MNRTPELSEPANPMAHPLTRKQREAVKRLADRYGVPYRRLRRAVSPPIPGSSICNYAAVVVNGLYYGIESDGHTHT